MSRTNTLHTGKYLFFFFFLLLCNKGFSQRSKDGAKIVTTAGTIVNEYTSLSLDANAGSTSITVANSNLNLIAGRFTAPLATGDLIMIIQMQGAAINGTPTPAAAAGDFYGIPNNINWGSITAYNNCGLYEFVQVSSVPNGTTINIDNTLLNSYTAAGKVQVVRVPRLLSLTLNSPATLSADPWDGAKGGILVVEVLNNTVINNGASINVSALGFRGGKVTEKAVNYTGYYSATNPSEGGEKGEGIAGYETDYTQYGGMYARGAAANAGGGANGWNGGGGGGANAGDINAWNGNGNPDTSTANFKTAWDLESVNFLNVNFHKNTSSGGGRGGYSASIILKDPTVLAPGDAGWSGDNRQDKGGRGGRPLDYSTGRLFFGGGGGAGDADNFQIGAGGNGGGMVYLMSYGTISGTGQILADGNAGTNSTTDGAGGGGAGGTIILNSVGTISGVKVQAKGGIGGNNIIPAGKNEAEGPGGGGGGGYIAATGAATLSASGGVNGTSDSPAMTKFKPNGATIGGPGNPNGSITNFTYTASYTPLSVCSGQKATLTAVLVGTVPAGIDTNWYDAIAGGNLLYTGGSYLTPALATSTKYYVGTSPGTYRLLVDVIVTQSDPTINAVAPFCISDPAKNLTAVTSGGVWTGIGITNTANGTFNPATAGAGNDTITYTLTNGLCTFSDTAIVKVNALKDATITPAGPFCIFAPAVNLVAATAGGIWSGTGITNTANGTFDPATAGAGSHTITYTISGACSSADSKVIKVNSTLDATISPAGPFCISAPASNLTAATAGGIWSGTGITNATNGTFDPTTVGTGNDTITYTISGACGNTDSKIIKVNSILDATITPAGPFCISDAAVNLVAATVGGTWSGTGITNTTNGTFDPATAGAGSHTITYTISGACGSTNSKIIVVNARPTANFNSSPMGIIPVNATVNFSNQSLGETSLKWNFGDIASGSGNTSTTSDPTHIYKKPGSYCITLLVASNLGCLDSARQCINISGENVIFVPDGFSPNNDGVNDVLYVRAKGNLKSLYFMVYDRWGEKVFETSNILKGWDGSYKGTALGSQVFVYYLNAEFLSGETITKKGDISIIKE